MDIPSYLSGAIFTKSHRVLRAAVVKCLGKHDLSPTAWSFLGTIISAPDGVRLVSVAKQLGVKAPLITAMANVFIERGLITRIPHHIDGRAKLLAITPKGKRFTQTVEKEMEKELTRLLQGLTKSDLTAYKKVLDTIITNGEQ